MPESDNVEISKNRRICKLTINNPEKRNLLSENILLEISRYINDLNDDRDIRAIIITGKGEKAFSSGYDISSIGDNDMLREYYGGHPLEIALSAIEEHPAPVIAMMNGHAFGAGLELAVTCDIRICASGAKLGMPPAKLGVAYTYSGMRKFINLIGVGNMKEMFLTGDPVNANKALQIGLVNHVVEKEELEGFTYNMAEKICENAPLSMESVKIAVREWQKSQKLSEEGDSAIRDIFDRIQNSSDYREGRKAFGEKRKPEFKGE